MLEIKPNRFHRGWWTIYDDNDKPVWSSMYFEAVNNKLQHIFHETLKDVLTDTINKYPHFFQPITITTQLHSDEKD